MSYGNLINNTFRVAGKYWWLWLFGFFVSLGDAGGSVQQLSGRFKVEDIDWASSEWLPAIALGVLAFAGLAALVYLVCKIFAECALMVAVRDINAGGRGSIIPSFKQGLPYFWRILALLLLLVLVVLTSILIGGGIVLLAFLATPILGVMVLLIVLPIWLVVFFIVEVVAAWAFRAAALDDFAVFEAIAEGWRLLRQKAGPSVAVGLIAIGSKIAFGLVALMLFAFVGIPFLVVGHVNLWLGLIPALVLGFFVTVIIEGFTGTYASALWTLAYLDLQHHSAAPGKQA